MLDGCSITYKVARGRGLLFGIAMRPMTCRLTLNRQKSMMVGRLTNNHTNNMIAWTINYINVIMQIKSIKISFTKFLKFDRKKYFQFVGGPNSLFCKLY